MPFNEVMGSKQGAQEGYIELTASEVGGKIIGGLQTKTQLNFPGEMPGKRFQDFAKEIWKLVDEKGVNRLVIDLRRNGGGDSRILDPFIGAVKKHPRLNQAGKLFVLIGRDTFSSAYLNALRLKRETKAILVGEPTGQKPNAYGEVRFFTLPNSKLTVRYSTKFFKTMEGDPLTLAPDLKIERSSEDFMKGRDPVLERVLNYEAK